MIRNRLFVFLLVMTCIKISLAGVQNDIDQYNVIWNEQSKNASETMPCGGGDMGLNVWVENGDLLFYISRSGTFDENNSMLKLGRVRVKLSPNPFQNGSRFKQELKLKEGYIEITGKNKGTEAKINIWVDVFRPVVHVEIDAKKAIDTEVVYENWRTQDRVIPNKERHQCYGFSGAPFDVITKKDNIQFLDDSVFWYHRNTSSPIFDETVKLQELTPVMDSLWNPVINNTFGGIMLGENMVPAGTTSGAYYQTNFAGWKLKSKKASKKHHIKIYSHIAQTDTYEEWFKGLKALVKEARDNKKDAWEKTKQWWAAYWNRSYIVIDGDASDEGWRIGRNFQLFRYQLGCNAFGRFPTKFNGGLFTSDPGYVHKHFNVTPDFRKWGGGSATAQNQRLLYWPMLKNGDFELMKPQFDFYLKALKNAEQRSRHYWGHKGACFTEQMETFGLPVAGNYSFKHPKGNYDPGIIYSRWIEYQWDTVLEFCLMILDVQRFAGKDISEYIPLIESCLTFFDEHYRYYANMRTVQTFDQNGHYVLYPGTACETYKMTTNSVTTVCGLKEVLTRMLELPDNYLTEAGREKWTEMLTHIPPITFREKEGKKVIAPAARWERINNHEFPQMYPVFPFNFYGIGRPGLDIAINTWNVGYDRDDQKTCNDSWHQSAIFCARMGLTNEAKDLVSYKLDDAKSRFPSFWGPGHDWLPDHNWGGSGMIALQEMIMQTYDKKIYIIPAWPKEWNASFKLHAPYNTTVEAKVVNGEIEDLLVTPAHRKKDLVIWEN